MSTSPLSEQNPNKAAPHVTQTIPNHPPPPPTSKHLSHSDLFKPQGTRILLVSNRTYDEPVVVTHNQASESSWGGLGRASKVLKSPEFEFECWLYANGTKASSARILRKRTVFLDTGHAFCGRPKGQVLKFCLVQESVLEMPDGGVNGTPVYRVRPFANVEEAKNYMLADAMDLGVGTIGFYIIVVKGAEVDGLFRKEPRGEEIWI
jgi:hypothetical protein